VKEMLNSKNWLLIGVPRNWETALSHPVPLWGLKMLYRVEFQALQPGDLLWFYATKPVGGVIGIGAVKDKYTDVVNLVWEEELVKKEVIWPLRFRIQVLKVLPLSRWRVDCLKINDFGLFWQRGFQLLAEEHITELRKRAESLFGKLTWDEMFVGATISKPFETAESSVVYQSETGFSLSHQDLQEGLAEIGKLQFYYSEIEYPLSLPEEKKSLDVVWKREIDGVPTFAFEIELSGMLERAFERLKFAFKRWNSQPRLVVPEDFVKKANNILLNAEKDFVEQLRIYYPAQIFELLNKKRELKNLEQQLKLY